MRHQRKEIPVPYLRANQSGIVVFALLAIVLRQPILLGGLWLVEVAGLLFGARANLFILTAKPFLKKKVAGAQTEAAELTRFNNTLAVLFLTVALLLIGLGFPVAGYTVAGVLSLVAFIATRGFCLGCVVYYQYKQYRYRRMTDHH